MAHGYEQVGVNEIRRILQEEYGVTNEETLAQTKVPLVELLLQAKTKKEKEQPEEEWEGQLAEETLDGAEPEEEIGTTEEEVEVEIPEVVPVFGSNDWADYVMRQFEEDEVVNECPTCDGCRRMVQKLVGPIISAGVKAVYPPTNDNQATATVVFQVELLLTNETHPAFEQLSGGGVLVMSDVADVNRFNTDPPYDRYPSATASTRAEGRIYRKLLGLKKITAEEKGVKAEKSDEQWNEDELIHDGQIAIIEMMCRPDRCDLSVFDFINCGQHDYASIHAIPKSTALRMIQKLNNIQQGADPRPKGVGRYDPNWRERK